MQVVSGVRVVLWWHAGGPSRCPQVHPPSSQRQREVEVSAASPAFLLCSEGSRLPRPLLFPKLLQCWCVSRDSAGTPGLRKHSLSLCRLWPSFHLLLFSRWTTETRIPLSQGSSQKLKRLESSPAFLSWSWSHGILCPTCLAVADPKTSHFQRGPSSDPGGRNGWGKKNMGTKTLLGSWPTCERWTVAWCPVTFPHSCPCCNHA